jgi:hypothetical protein
MAYNNYICYEREDTNKISLRNIFHNYILLKLLRLEEQTFSVINTLEAICIRIYTLPMFGNVDCKFRLSRILLRKCYAH